MTLSDFLKSPFLKSRCRGLGATCNNYDATLLVVQYCTGSTTVVVVIAIGRVARCYSGRLKNIQRSCLHLWNGTLDLGQTTGN